MQKQTIRRALALVLVSALVADAQTGPAWSKNKSYRTLAPKQGIIIPEEVMKAELAVYTKEHVKMFFDNLPSPAFFNVLGLHGLSVLKDDGYVLVPVPLAEIGKSAELWLAIQYGADPKSFNENWDEQEKRARGHKRMPTVDELRWFTKILWKVYGKQPFQHVYVRTSSPVLGGGHVCVGENEEGVLKIANCADEARFLEVDSRKVSIVLAPVAKR